MARFHSSPLFRDSAKSWRLVAPFAALGVIGLHEGCASNSGTQNPVTTSGTSSGTSSGSSATTGTSAGTGTSVSGTTAPSGTQAPTTGSSSGTSTSGTVTTSGTSSGAASGTVTASGSSGTVTASGAGSGTVTGSGTTSGAATSGAAPATCPGAATAVSSTTLPYAVDSDFAATGYEGDYEAIVNTGDLAGTACGGLSPASPRAAKAKCWLVTYTVPEPDAAMPTTGFAGVAWQANVQSMGGGAYYNNFGVAPGVIPPAGATEASFWAKGAVGGEQLQFSVGSAATAPCTDSVISTTSVTLTTTWTQYSIPFPAPVNYAAGQVNGFTWGVAGAPPGAVVSFYFDNVQWDANSPADAGSPDTGSPADAGGG